MDKVRQEKFVALDSLRGICALAVVMFHFRTTGTLSNIQFFRHSWMFVDFFFVLSGFVVASAYGERFVAGTVTITRFMGLRLGRIYPLHLAMMLAMICLELILVVFDFTTVTTRVPFEKSRSLTALASNFALLHVFGLHDQLTWNMPSWSIAAEIWVYFVFAICIGIFRRTGWTIIAGLGFFAFLILATLAPKYLNSTFDFGFFRCLYGFSLGALAYRMAAKGIAIGGTLAELTTLAVCVLFVGLVEGGRVTLFAPLLFVLPVLTFAIGEGKVTRLLAVRPLVWLGTVSYSIYMVHGFIQARIGDLIKVAGALIGVSLTATGDDPEFPAEVFAGAPITLDLLTLAMLALVIAAASGTYLLIERPCRELSRSVFAPTVRPEQTSA